MTGEHERADAAGPFVASEAHECKRRAEAFLGQGETDIDIPRAIAWGLLAVAAELHIIRKELRRKR
ncbi:hypothetical protein [Streptomyces sp. S.PB5]|uniref:hypothetical protein n=1 Tax=Streptomyces sp. S.PB5 TaxID=3020844 RepID=UPI0025AF5912|nr:hypothetical protein [Streptomyces sp. S.PB5]MDN3021540.1 hypothetical protein [Streptomyces sp. S.PB5]